MKRVFCLKLRMAVMVSVSIALAISCNKIAKDLPTVTTSGITAITHNSAKGGGEVTDEGGSVVAERGICWSVYQNPTIADIKTIDGQGAGVFISDITSLIPDEVYFVRAYATNTSGTAYGSEVSFVAGGTSSVQDTFTDTRDGHEYRSQLIGSQIWMAENLTYLPSVSPPEAGSNVLPFYYVYGCDSTILASASDSANFKMYGVLYNWPAAKVSCPSGWHLPSDAEWKTLIETVGSPAGGKLKEIGTKITDTDTTHWLTPNTGATNSSGFTAVPGGERYSLASDSTVHEKFRYINRSAIYWSSFIRDGISSWAWHLYFDSNRLDRDLFSNSNGFSVRCLKD